MRLFLETLRETCRECGPKAALVLPGEGSERQVSFDSLRMGSLAAAQWLDGMGVTRGDRVAFCLPKSLAAIQIHLAACSMGAISLPLNPAYSKAELDYIVRDSGARVLIVARDNCPTEGSPGALDVPCGRLCPISVRDFEETMALQPAPERDPAPGPSDPALMLYTSGTTGHPKGACMSHASLTANMDMLRDAWQWTREDTLLHILPLFHVHGLLVALHGALHVGATTVMHAKFDAPAVTRALADGPATVFMGVPTVYRRILAEVGDRRIRLSGMRLLTCGSDRLPVELFEAIERQLGHRVVERYGMTETGIMLSNPVDGERVAGQVGVPLPGVRMRVRDPRTNAPTPVGEVGEFQTRGPHVFLGYWQDRAKTRAAFTEDGWFRTGDLGRCGPDGRFEIKGRQNDLIISGGFNVYPAEVEHVLARHPGVAQCAVAGLPDAEWGEAVTAFVVPADPCPAEHELIRHCRGSLAAYKAPKSVRFVDSLPRNAMGKVRKDALVAHGAERERFAARSLEGRLAEIPQLDRGIGRIEATDIRRPDIG